jgi:hypothetical protein
VGNERLTGCGRLDGTEAAWRTRSSGSGADGPAEAERGGDCWPLGLRRDRISSLISDGIQNVLQ